MASQEVSEAFLDTMQYSIPSILNYEAVYGEDYVSPGGEKVAKQLIEKWDFNFDLECWMWVVGWAEVHF